ncbi:MAG TPA: hypothetical protein VFL54_07675, partial [Gammaproteobacteria bacterium]|nr:hypothetical protein [Gammaproteobacteria bacterium]
IPEEGMAQEFHDRLEHLCALPREQRFEELRARPLKALSPAERAELQRLAQTGKSVRTADSAD